MTRRISIIGILVAGCLLSSFIAFAFMERHWNEVTRRLSEATARDIAAVVDLYEAGTPKEEAARLIHIVSDRLGLSIAELPAGPLPVPQPKPFFNLLDRNLSEEVRANIKHPFWIDTVGQSHQVEVRVKLDRAVLRFIAPRWGGYASNSHIFVIWMVGCWVMLLTVGYFILRPALRAGAERARL